MAGRSVELSRATSRASAVASDFSFEDQLEDEEDMSDVGGDIEAHARQIFESLQELKEEIQRRVSEAVDCTGVSEDDAYLCLRRYGWEVASFNEAFFEDSDRVRGQAGAFEDVGTSTSSSAAPQLCGICFCDPGIDLLPCQRRPLKNKAGASDRHPSYCVDCWRQYIELAVQEGKKCLELRCVTPGCDEAIRPSTFARILGGGDVLDRYQRFAAESLIDDSRGGARWCPGQGCGRAAIDPTSSAAGTREVRCPCGMTWCFGCGADAHLPVSCEVVKKWEAKNREEAANASWIKVNTKLCPKCGNPIEKNGGCMHMTCQKPGGCGHEFCWICMQNWSTHKSCNALVSDKVEKEKEATKHELLRYSHFYERFLNHQQAEQFAATSQFEGMEVLASNLSDVNGYSVNDVNFLGDAVLEIRSSRRFLKWTYAHAYFANYKGDKKALFEFHQAQLEGTLERLSDIMENTTWGEFVGESLENRPFYDLRAQLISLTGVVHGFFGGLQEAMVSGSLFQQ